MKVTAIRGTSQYLLMTSTKAKRGRVLDVDQKLLFPLEDVQVILKWGYWLRAKMPKMELDELLKGIKRVPAVARRR